MAKAEDKSVVELLKAYASAERRIQAAASWRACTVKQYQEHLERVVNDATAILNTKNRAFGTVEIDKAHQEGQKQTDSASPQRNGHISRKEADAILRKAGFRYSAKEFGYDTYIELQSATQAAGAGFLERVNKTVEDLKRRGQDTIYNVTQAIQKDIEAQGLLNVEYSNGRKTSISAYARMAARSARMESQNIGAFGRALENGTDYVRCTTIYPTCEICAKYQGRIYCISGRDKRFPALFETALRHGYALIHPNCRHEFIPVWLELMDENELRQAIEQSRIPSGDTRSERERNAYADWQDKNRRYYNERLYFEQAKLRLGSSMPYKDIGAFRRSYHAREGSLAHERSHNLIRDYEKYIEYKDVLKSDPDFPKTLAKFQEIKYNEDKTLYQKLKREKHTVSEIKGKGWSESFTQKAVTAYYEFKEKGIEFTDHGIARFLQRGFDKEEIANICENYPFNFIQEDGKKIKFYKGTAIIYSSQDEEIVSILHRQKPNKEWKNV